MLCGLFHAFDKTDQAWRSRVVIVGAIIAFAILQWLYFRAVGIRWLTAICFAFGTSVLPGLLVFSYHHSREEGWQSLAEAETFEVKLKQRIQERMGNSSKAVFSSGEVTWKKSRDSLMLDVARLLRDRPELLAHSEMVRCESSKQ